MTLRLLARNEDGIDEMLSEDQLREIVGEASLSPEQITQLALAHARNSDTALAAGTPDAVSAASIRALVGGAAEVSFSFGDATPKNLIVVTGGKVVLRTTLVLLEGFDGASAQFAVGDAADPQRLMANAQVDAASPGTYETTPAHRYPEDTQLFLTITPGFGATRGNGLIQLEFST